MKPMLVSQTIHDELENWARVVRDPLFIARRCKSAEGRYRPEKVKDERERELTAMPEPDHHAGMLAERVISHPNFPALARQMLVGYYVLRAQPRQVCRKCAVPQSQYDSMMGWSANIFKNRLDKAQNA